MIGDYAARYEAIDWGKREREAALKEGIVAGTVSVPSAEWCYLTLRNGRVDLEAAHRLETLVNEAKAVRQHHDLGLHATAIGIQCGVFGVITIDAKEPTP